MARKRPDDRLEQLLACATRVFVAQGYRRTQMADVAREMGISAGALYGYVESKEALFYLLIDRAVAGAPADAPALPVRTPAPGATLIRLREIFALETRLPQLAAASARARAPSARRELEAVLGELYDLIERTRSGTALIERSALDMPELATLFYVEVRRDLIARLARYLDKRIAAGQLRRVPDPGTVARLVLETITWFARHRLRDADSAAIDDAAARITTMDFLLAGLLPVAARAAR
jgi:AcrR family transcriptional regulator